MPRTPLPQLLFLWSESHAPDLAVAWASNEQDAAYVRRCCAAAFRLRSQADPPWFFAACLRHAPEIAGFAEHIGTIKYGDVHFPPPACVQSGRAGTNWPDYLRMIDAADWAFDGMTGEDVRRGTDERERRAAAPAAEPIRTRPAARGRKVAAGGGGLWS
jgi:hypothetical protein